MAWEGPGEESGVDRQRLIAAVAERCVLERLTGPNDQTRFMGDPAVCAAVGLLDPRAKPAAVWILALSKDRDQRHRDAW